MREFLVSGNNGSVVLPLAVFDKSRTAFAAREKRRAQTNNNSADSGCTVTPLTNVSSKKPPFAFGDPTRKNRF